MKKTGSLMKSINNFFHDPFNNSTSWCSDINYVSISSATASNLQVGNKITFVTLSLLNFKLGYNTIRNCTMFCSVKIGFGDIEGK